MANLIKISPAQMKQLAGQYADKISQFQSTRNNVAAEIQNLASHYSGESARIYFQALNEWDAEFRQVIDAATTMRDRLLSQAGENVSQEADRAQQAQSVAAAMGNGLPGLNG
jgi:WXG100 family type VII secretion target